MKLGRIMTGNPMRCGRRDRLVEVAREARLGGREPDLAHRLAELLAVLGGRDGLGPRADHLDAERVEHALADELHREVERGLAAERREQRVGSLACSMIASTHAGVERLDVGRVGGRGVRHDRRGVRVHEHDAVALLAQHPAGLGPE